jgi:hypothetical protein
MEQAEGFRLIGKEDWVCKLQKGIYGLHQSAMIWYNMLKVALEHHGFISVKADSTLFFWSINGSIIATSWHVDDRLCVAQNQQLIWLISLQYQTGF